MLGDSVREQAARAATAVLLIRAGLVSRPDNRHTGGVAALIHRRETRAQRFACQFGAEVSPNAFWLAPAGEPPAPYGFPMSVIALAGRPLR
jgi:hypothetical protein